MKQFWIVIVLIYVGFLSVEAQTDFVYLVKFTDKTGTTGSLSTPISYLSQESISRRLKNNVAIDSTDLPVSKLYIDSIRIKTASDIHGQSKWFNMAFFVSNDSFFVNKIDTISFVDTVFRIAIYPNGYGRPSGNGTDVDTSENADNTSSPLYKNYNYGANTDHITMHNGQFLHQNGYTGSGINIAVLDGSFYSLYSNIAYDSVITRGQILHKHNFVLQNDQVDWPGDGHGAEVLSVMCTDLNGTYVGAAPSADYFLMVTEDHRSEQPIEMYNWVMGVELADSLGADVIQSSVGYTTFDNIQDNLTHADLNGKSTAMSRAATLASRKGIVVVATTGNEGTGFWSGLSVPSDADSILSVGGCNNTNQPVSLSAHGPTADGRRKPEVISLGWTSPVMNTGGQVSGLNGTSGAAPMISGLAACLIQAFPGKTAYEIRHAIIESSSIYSNPNNTFGYGIPNFQAAFNLLGIDQFAFSRNLGFTLYPNPTHGEMVISKSDNNIHPLSISFYNSIGQLAYSKEWEDMFSSLHIHTVLPEGLYFVIIYSKEGTQTIKTYIN